MNCEKAKRILVDYAEGLLGDGKRQALEEHLSSCETCKGELEQIEMLKEGVLALEAPERDAEFWRRFDNKLSRRLDEEETVVGTLEFRRRAVLPLAAAVAVAVLAVVSLLMFGMRGSGLAPAPQLAADAPAGNGADSLLWELDAASENIFDDTLLAQADSSNSDIEQAEEDLFLLVEEDLGAVPDEVVVYSIYEPTIDDLLDDLSDEEFEEIYNDLASI
jgi:hypothetical protein